MLHLENNKAARLLLEGRFGLEKEGLRIDREGYPSHSPDPFYDHSYIVKDFSENQTEINTPVTNGPAEAVAELKRLTDEIERTLADLPDPEYLWPFSNPPYIRGEEDIPIARYRGADRIKTRYREYLAQIYGRYKMAFSGIHLNFSFGEELLRESFRSDKEKDFQKYKNALYLDLAAKMETFAWIMVAVTSASPLMDISYFYRGKQAIDVFNGMASTRCSELGYWNAFTPVLDYSDLASYTESIRKYVREGLLAAPSELYFPIRLKPSGSYNIDCMEEQGVDHIELRMIDLNPLSEAGIDVRDVFFAQLLMVFLSVKDRVPKANSNSEHIQAVQNMKYASRYDLNTVNIKLPGLCMQTAAKAGLDILESMEDFYRNYPQKVRETLAFEKAKFTRTENRYAWKVYREFSGGYVQKGLEFLRKKSGGSDFESAASVSDI